MAVRVPVQVPSSPVVNFYPDPNVSLTLTKCLMFPHQSRQNQHNIIIRHHFFQEGIFCFVYEFHFNRLRFKVRITWRFAEI